MGQSTNGMLVYGYDLGSDDDGWKIQGAGEFGEMPALDWFDADAEDGDDFATAAEQRLLVELAGFTETDWQVDGYFERERAAKAQLSVEFDTYCSGEYPMYVLAAKVITVYRGSVEEIDMVDLAAAPAREGWDDKLRTALAALGITPTQEQAKWLLVSYWG